jgi:Winged helix-turn helix
MAQAARRLTAKDPGEKPAHRRLTVLGLAERLGNVAEACRRGGIDRTSFYEWKRRFQLEGLDGLKDPPPLARSHPMTTAPEVVARIAEPALRHPAHGCNKIEALPALEGRRGSAITVQKTWATRAWAPGTSAGWPWSGRTRERRSNPHPSRRRSWRS